MHQIEKMMEVMNDARKRAATNMRLGDFIRALEARAQDQRIAFDFCSYAPGSLDSYRGFYEDLSWSFGERYAGVTVADVLAKAKAAIGQTFEGYKGGDFTMSEDTILWVAPYGESHSTAITGITGDKYQTIIETGWVRS